MSVTLDKIIDDELLQTALLNVIDRFPSFRYALRQGLYWWYFKGIEADPVLGNAAPLNSLPFNNNNGYLFQLSCQDKTINLDVFHALTDGTGAMTFLLSIAGEYLRLKEKVDLEYNNWVLNPFDAPKESEMQDCFDSFTSGRGSLEKNHEAYHVKGTEEGRGVLNNTRVSIETESLVRVAKSMGCTVTELVTSAMIKSLQTVRDMDKSLLKKNHIKITVPVNLRPMFGYNTFRNFSSYVNLGVDVSSGNLSLQEIISEVSAQKKREAVANRLKTKIVANVQLENSLSVRCLPRVIKREVMSAVFKAKGFKFNTQTLSNLGNITLPESMRQFVTDLDFQLGRQIGNFGCTACVSVNGKTNINLSRKIRENDFERFFVEELQGLGVNILSCKETLCSPSHDGEKSLGATIGHQAVAFCSQAALGTLLIPVGLLCSSTKLIKILGPFFLM